MVTSEQQSESMSVWSWNLHFLPSRLFGNSFQHDIGSMRIGASKKGGRAGKKKKKLLLLYNFSNKQTKTQTIKNKPIWTCELEDVNARNVDIKCPVIYVLTPTHQPHFTGTNLIYAGRAGPSPECSRFGQPVETDPILKPPRESGFSLPHQTKWFSTPSDPIPLSFNKYFNTFFASWN